MVLYSLPVKFHEDHFYLLEAYKGFIGRVVAVQVSMSTMDRSQNLFSSKALITPLRIMYIMLNIISKTVAYTTLVVATARHRKSLKLYSRCRVF